MVADSEEAARHMHPCGSHKWTGGQWMHVRPDGTLCEPSYSSGTWTQPELVQATLIGTAAPDTTGVI